MQEEVERVEIWQFETLDFAEDHVAEMLFDGRGGDVFDEQRIVLGFVGDEADVCGVAFVAAAGVGDVYELNFHTTIIVEVPAKQQRKQSYRKDLRAASRTSSAISSISPI